MAAMTTMPESRVNTATAAMAVLIVHELRCPEPVIDFRMLKIFGFALAVTLS